MMPWRAQKPVGIAQPSRGDRVDRGIRFAVSKMTSMRAGEMGFSTSEVGDLVVEGTAT